MFTETIALEDKVSAPALQAAKQMMALDGAIDKTEQALTLAAATGGTSSKKYQALSKDLAGYKNALLAVPPQLIAEASAAQAAALAEEKLHKEQAKAKGPAKQAALAPVAVDTSGLSKSKDAVFDAANAMNVGKETIAAAIGGIKKSFSALASGDIQGAIAGVTESVAGMAKMLDMVVPGLGQAVSTIITLAGGLAGAFAGLVKQGMAFAIEASEGKQAMLGLLGAMGDGVTTGAQYEEMIDGLKNKYGIAKDSLVGWTKELQAMGRTDVGQIEDDLLAIASAEAIVKGGGAALIDWTKKIEMAVQAGGKIKIATKALKDLGATGANVGDVAKQMGMSVEDLTKALDKGEVNAVKFGDALKESIQKKGAGPLAKMSASLPNLKKLLEESIGDLFEDIDVGPFLAQVKSLFEIFGQGKASGNALKTGVQGAFQGIFDAATKVVPYIKHFLLDLVILGLKAYIGLKPVIQFLKELSQKQEVIDGFKAALIMMGVAIAVSMAPLLAVVAIVVLLIATLGALAAMGAMTTAAVVKFGVDVFNTLGGYIAQAKAWGNDFINGIISGLGIGPIIAAVTNVANAAKDTFKSVLGIASPSKVMALQGGFVAEGVAEGIDGGAPAVGSASANLAKATTGGFSDGADGAPGAAGASSSGGGITVEATIQIMGGDKQTMAELTEEGISLLFEKIALQQGLA